MHFGGRLLPYTWDFEACAHLGEKWPPHARTAAVFRVFQSLVAEAKDAQQQRPLSLLSVNFRETAVQWTGNFASPAVS